MLESLLLVPEFVQGSSRINISPMYQIVRENIPRYQLTRPSTPVYQLTRANTPDYFSDDAGDIDDAFLHELDQLETQLINGSSGAVGSTSAFPPSGSFTSFTISHRYTFTTALSHNNNFFYTTCTHY